MTQINDMIETLASAKLAMDENPNLKQQIAELQAKLSEMQQAHDVLNADHTHLSLEHANVLGAKAELEASLEAARFQELASSEKLNKLVQSFSTTLLEVMPPKPVAAEPEPVVVAQSPDVGLDWPVRTETWPQAVVTEPKAEPQVEDFSPSSEQPSTLGCTEPEGPSAINPTPVPMQDSGGGSTVTEPAKPYDGKPYSFKPEAMSWPEWISGGGQRPWYIEADGTEKYSHSA